MSIPTLKPPAFRDERNFCAWGEIRKQLCIAQNKCMNYELNAQAVFGGGCNLSALKQVKQ